MHIAAALQYGSLNAFKALYNECYYFLRYFVKQLIANSSEAEDKVVEAFVELLKKKKADFESLPDLLAFLPVTVCNATYDYLCYKEIEILPLKCQQVFKLFFVEGLIKEEIAPELGKYSEAVLNPKSRALDRFVFISNKPGMPFYKKGLLNE